MTAKRFMLNETSYHGYGAKDEVITEAKARGFKKALIVTDADLVKFGVVKKSPICWIKTIWLMRFMTK